MLFCKSEMINLLFGSSNRLSMLCHLVIRPFFLLFIQIFAHYLLEHILFIMAFSRLHYFICVFVIQIFIAPLFHFPFIHSLINGAMPNCTRCLCTIIDRSIFPFPSIANTNMFVYMCCCIDPLPSAAAAAAADSRSIQSVIANCYTLLRTIYVCTMYMHCNRSLSPFSIILKSKHCVLYICNGIMPLLPLRYQLLPEERLLIVQFVLHQQRLDLDGQQSSSQQRPHQQRDRRKVINPLANGTFLSPDSN